uniref:SPRY domain-containing protein n=1 Tax=Meloidogyne incognita TaxID=6306 RepID=A0A914NR93_MELIC
MLEELLTSNLDLKDVIIKLFVNVQDLQKMFLEEKNKNSALELRVKNLEDKNQFLENKIKKNKQRVQLIRNEYKEEILNLKKQNDKKIQKVSSALNKRINNLTSKLEQLDKMSLKRMCFLPFPNKWTTINSLCCDNDCVNTKAPGGLCVNGNGFINLYSDSVKYYECEEDRGTNVTCSIEAQYRLTNPEKDYFFYSLFYYEVTCQFVLDRVNYENELTVGFFSNRNIFAIEAHDFRIFYKIRGEEFLEDLDEVEFIWKNGDVLGCGLVFPPTDMPEKQPYVFFTQNGKLIGKSIKGLSDNYCTPYLSLKCCSVKTNFGEDLDNNPFKYDVSKHHVSQEFYENSEE